MPCRLSTSNRSVAFCSTNHKAAMRKLWIFEILVLFFTIASVKCIEFRPPATPLVVQSPFLSIWSMSDNLASNYTRHWTDSAAPLYASIRIDEESYRLIGTSSGDNNIPGAVHNLPIVSSLTSLYVFPSIGNKIALNLSFTTPSLLDDIETLAMPCTYLNFDVLSIDGDEHDVQIYFDTDAELVTQTESAKITWERINMENDDDNNDEIDNEDILAMRLGQVDQFPLAYADDKVKIDWGWWMLLTNQSLVSGSVLSNRSNARLSFEDYGNLNQLEDDLGNTRTAKDNYLSMCICFDLGTVDTGNIKSVWLSLILDEILSINYYGNLLPPYWRRNLTIGDSSVIPYELLKNVFYNRETLLDKCNSFNIQFKNTLLSVFNNNNEDVQVAEEYALLGQLAYRQVTGGLSLTWNPDKGVPWYFLKEISTDGDISTIDLWWPTSPMILSLSPKLMVYALEPLLSYMANETTLSSLHNHYHNSHLNSDDDEVVWPNKYCAHDLGVWPIANRNYKSQEYMPIETTADMLFMFAATILLAENNDLLNSELLKYWELVQNWGEYLLSDGVLPYPSSQKSTTDWQGQNANTTQLISKGIMGIGCYAYLCMLKGDIELGTQAYTIAASYTNVWMNEAFVTNLNSHDDDNSVQNINKHAMRELHDTNQDCSGDHDSWSLQYSLFEQQVFGFEFFNQDILNSLLDYYGESSQLHTYGVPMDCTTNTVGGPTWLAMMAAAGYNGAHDTDDDDESLWHPTSLKMISALFKFANETTLRLPFVDFHNTDTAGARVTPSQRARPAVGAIFTPLLISISQNLSEIHQDRKTDNC